MHSAAEIDDLLYKLSENSKQKSASKYILDQPDFVDGSAAIEDTFQFRKIHLLQIISIFKVVLSYDLLLSIILLLNCLIKNQSDSSISRAENIVSSGVLEIVIKSTNPIFLSPKPKSMAFSSASLLFLYYLSKLSVIAVNQIIDTAFNELSSIIKMNDSVNLFHMSLVMKIIRTWCHHGTTVRTKIIQKKLPDILMNLLERILENEFEEESSKSDENRLLLSQIKNQLLKSIKNLCVHSHETKIFLLRHGLIDHLDQIIKSQSESTDIIQATMIYSNLFADITSKGWRISDTNRLLTFFPSIVELWKKNSDVDLVINCLRAIKNALVYHKDAIFQYLTEFIDSLSVLMTDQHLEKQTLAVEITHILTQTDQGCNLLRKNITAIIKSLLLMLGFVIPSHVNQVDPTNPTASNDLIKLIFSTLCNLSFQDKISQKICHVGGPELMNQIFAFVKKNEANPAICKQALECVRNLCIDDLATKAILDTGTESLLDILKNGLPDLRLECLEIIRNIFLQNQACYINLQNQPGFIHEVQISLVDPSTELNLVALSIIKKWVESKGGRTAYCIALLRCGIIPTLSYVLSVVEASKRAEVLKCLNSFIKLKRELGESEDPWQLIKKSWDYKDILIGRTVKGKKSSKRKLRKKKL